MLTTALLLVMVPMAPPPHAAPPKNTLTHADHGHGPHGQHGNPEDVGSYIARMEDPERDVWQKPSEVVKALGLKPGQTACNVGAGPGYFSFRLAEAVGPSGRVFAVDVEPRMLAALTERMTSRKVRTITPVLGLPDEPLLPSGACDVILVVDTYHHFPDRVAYLRTLKTALRAGGTLVLIDFHAKELPVGPGVDHKVAREVVVEEATRAGFRSTAEHTFLPYQYALVFAPG